MEGQAFFTPDEHKQLIALYRRLLHLSGDTLQKDDCKNLKKHLMKVMSDGTVPRNAFGMNPVIKDMQTAVIVAEEIGMRRASILGIMLHSSVKFHLCTLDEVKRMYGEDVAGIIRGLVKINELYSKSPTIESENFRNLLLSFAQDMRVVLIMIADRVNLMRQIKDSPNEEARLEVANEAAFLYAPLAHKLGLYKLKSELEDLWLKYTQHDIYYHIKEKLNATKAARDRYIDAFIKPVKEKLEEAGLKFHIKGRTKSIHSIYQKMKKQGCPFEGVYDLFAIRVILDSPLDKEKQECWQAYSIVTDMYLPNPKRLRDWLSVPKSNGYESLHITVMGPEGKWVEVQIRTERMDEIAEKGLAAHWRYKGIKGESGLDEWLNSIRETLENADNDMEAMDQFKLDLYKDEVFVFTPKGEIKMMSQLLDSAVFPGIQGGPLEHVIAAKAVAFGECLQPEYKEYQTQVKKNAAVLAQALIDRGFTIVSGGTDNHSMLVDLRTKYPDLTGKVAEKALVAADITVNKNMVPFDSRSAFQTSGIRLGTPAITTRGAKEDLMLEIAEMIETVLSNVDNEEVIAQVRARVNETMKKYPIFAY